MVDLERDYLGYFKESHFCDEFVFVCAICLTGLSVQRSGWYTRFSPWRPGSIPAG